MCQEAVGVENLFDVGAHLVGKDGEYADDLASLLGLHLAHAVVGLYHLGGLDEDGLTRGTLVVHDAIDFPFDARRHRQHQSAVAQGGRSVLVHQSVALGGMQYSI